MNSRKSFVAGVVAAIVLSSAVASAEEPSMSGCLHMSKQVDSAFANASAQSQNYGAARDAQRAGREFCAAGLYARGVASYRDALTDLGQEMNDPGQSKS